MQNRKKPLYFVWRSMKHRVNCPTYIDYARYGGRGITICSEWQNSFQDFETWALNNGYQKGLYLDREDNNKGYYPENCRWVTADVSVSNRNLKTLEAFNEHKTLTDWAKDSRCKNITYDGLRQRLKTGMTLEEALTTPRLRNYW